MHCRVCNVAEGQWFQRAGDGSTKWWACKPGAMGSKELFPGQVATIRAGVCQGKACMKRASEQRSEK